MKRESVCRMRVKISISPSMNYELIMVGCAEINWQIKSGLIFDLYRLSNFNCVYIFELESSLMVLWSERCVA